MKTYTKNIIVFIATIVLFSGCVGGSKKQVVVQELPSWYINAPSNNAVFIYGEGTAKSMDEAKTNGLNSMASRLVVSVSSSLESSTTTSTDGKSSNYSKNINKSVKQDVQKIKFTNAKVEKSSKIGDEFYVLMKVNRDELFENKNKEFIINDKRVDVQYNSLKKYSKLEQIHMLQALYPKVISGKRQAVVLNAINNEFEYAPYIKKYDSYIDAIYNLKNDSIIVVQTNEKQQYFADQLIDQLNKQQYKISRSTGDIIIKLNNKIKYSVARGWNIAKVSTTLSVLANGKIVSNRTISSLGRSSTSKESALEDASLKFIKKIKEESLDKVIFSK
ncbi:MAG: LPP20 family lipoprotein [Campylobacterota bacterium]|nr:LPP20 family lipoprotein [Campylobacterota bacterium]